MSCIQAFPGAGPCIRHSSMPPAGVEARLRDRLLGLLARKLLSWIARGKQRCDLAQLDDRLLRDIGITRAAAMREAAKPFWLG